MEEVRGGKVELSCNPDDAYLPVNVFLRGDRDESAFGVKRIFDEMRSGGFSKKVSDGDHDTDEESDVEAEDKTSDEGEKKDPSIFSCGPEREFDFLKVEKSGNC